MFKKSVLLLCLVPFVACKKQHIIYPRLQTIVQTVYASGKIMADSEYTVSALSAGIVVRKLVREGDQVKKGQVLYILRHTAPAVRLDAANSTVLTARQNLSPDSRVLNDLRIAEQNAQLKFSNDSAVYIRYKNLWAQNIGTKINLDNMRLQYEMSFNLRKSAHEKYLSAVNDLRLAMKNAQSLAAGSKSDFDNYFIKAESTGTVYQLEKQQGDAVKNNEPMALLGRTGKRIIRLAVDQQDIRLVKIGQTLLLKTDVNGDRIYQARVSRIYPVMNEADQTFGVDARFIGEDEPVYIHSSVEANIIVAKKAKCLTIPLVSLLSGDSILVQEKGKIVARAVKTGIRTNSEVEIISGANLHTAIINP